MSTNSNSGATAAGGSSSGGSSRETSGASAVGGGTSESYRGSTDYDTDRSVPVRQEYVEPRTTQVREEHVVHQQAPVQPQPSSGPVNVAVGAERKDGVRWGPVWAGLLTALTTFLLLELMFYAFGWLTLDPGSSDSGNSSALVTGILALVAFFLGGLIAGATALHKGLFSGLLHGFLVWALGVIAFIALTFFGASALLGSFGDLTSQLGVGPQEVQSATDVSEAQADAAAAETKDAAAPAFWGLFLPLAAAMVGGLIGSKIWPRKSDTDPETVQLRS
jgi:hypothetical protein